MTLEPRKAERVVRKRKRTDEHMFSIELNSKDHVKNLALSNAEGDKVLLEGFLGKLRNLSFTEGIMLEIRGTNGSLRMDFTEEELKGLLPKRLRSASRSTKETTV